MSNAQITFEAFKATMEAAGLDLTNSAVIDMAVKSGKVDLTTIPTRVSVEIKTYKPTKSKEPLLYVEVLELVPGAEKPTKLAFQRLSYIKSKVNGLPEEVRQLEILAEVLPGVVESLESGEVDLPDGWIITDDDDNGFTGETA